MTKEGLTITNKDTNTHENLKKVQTEELASPVTISTNENIPEKADTQAQIKKLHEDIETALDAHQAENNTEVLTFIEKPTTNEFTIKHKSSKNFLRRAAVITGFILSGLMGAEKTEAQAEKTKVYTDTLEYVRAQQQYEDSLDLYKNSTINITKLTKQLGIAPKITKYDELGNAPFSSVYAKNHKGLGFIGTESDKYFKYIISGADGNTYRGIDLTNETPSSLQKKFSAAKEKYLLALQQNNVYSENQHDSLLRRQLYIENNTVKIKNITLNYHFVQKYHSHILPDKKAEFIPSLNYSFTSKNKLTFDPNLIYEKEHTRSTSDDYYVNEIKKPQKENTIFTIFGNNTADGQKFYEYAALETESTDIQVYLYDTPKYKPVYVKPIPKDTLVLTTKDTQKVITAQLNKNEASSVKQMEGEPIYYSNGDIIGYMKDGVFEKFHSEFGLKQETINLLFSGIPKETKKLDTYLRLRFGAYYKGMKKD